MKTSGMRKAAHGIACGFTLLCANTGLAQEQPQLEEVVVTATGTSISGVGPVGSESVSVTREQIEQTGLNQPFEILNTLPQVHNLASPGGATGQRGQVVNLRGLGANATLILVDGRRIVPSGTAANFLEANQVPASAIERIEIVADGQSAIYGSDAIAGVVNYVLRKDFSGVELSARYKQATTDYDEKAATFLAGTRWESLGGFGGGNVLLSYEYTDQSPMLRASSPFLRQDLTQYGGNDARLNANNATPSPTAGNIVVGPLGPNTTIPSAGNYTYYGLPANFHGIPTVADLKLNQPNLTDSAQFTDYLNTLKRHQVVLYGSQNLTDSVSLFYQGFYSKEDSIQRTLQTANIFGRRLCVLPGTPFYVPGINAANGPNVSGCGTGGAPGPAGSYEVQYNFSKDFGYGNSTYFGTSNTHTLGVKAELPGEWHLESYVTQGKNKSCGACVLGVFPNMDALQNQVNLGNINPYDTAPLTSAQLATFIGDNRQDANNRLRDVALRVDGPLFSLPAGQLRAALGAEYSNIHQDYLNGANRGVNNQFVVDTTTAITRTVKAAYTEVYAPLGGGVALDGAIRYEKYSDFGNTTNPKLGLTWKANESISLRGSWGRSFRAPDLPQLNENTVRILIPVPQLNAVTNVIPPSFCAPAGCFSTMLLAIGANGDLGPERAKTWSAGFDFKPQWLAGFKTSLTYYNVSYKDRIVAPIDNYTDTAEHYALYQKYVVLTPTPAGCVNTNPATWSPALQAWMSEPNVFGTPAQFWPGCQIQAVLNRFTHNDASTKQDGLDLTMNYAFDTSLGAWNLNLTASKILSATQHLIDGGPESDALGRINYPVSLRGRGGVTWSRGGLSANLWLNYVDSYWNDLPITVGGVRQQVSEVPSWTTVDASLSYRIEKGASAPWLGGTRVGLAVQNLFDRDPPVVLSTANGDAFDAQNAQVFGATWQLELSKAF